MKTKTRTNEVFNNGSTTLIGSMHEPTINDSPFQLYSVNCRTTRKRYILILKKYRVTSSGRTPIVAEFSNEELYGGRKRFSVLVRSNLFDNHERELLSMVKYYISQDK